MLASFMRWPLKRRAGIREHGMTWGGILVPSVTDLNSRSQQGSLNELNQHLLSLRAGQLS